MSGFGGDGACSGANEKPLGGAANAAPRAATARDAQSVVAFAGECGGFAAVIGEISLGRGGFFLARFAVEGEIIERVLIFGGGGGVWVLGSGGFKGRGGVEEEGGREKGI